MTKQRITIAASIVFGLIALGGAWLYARQTPVPGVPQSIPPAPINATTVTGLPTAAQVTPVISASGSTPTASSTSTTGTAAVAFASSGISSAVSATAAPAASNQIGILTTAPEFVFTNTTTTITFTVEITNPTVIPASVNLQSTNASGTVLSILGGMTQNSSSPTFYSATLPLDSPAGETLYFQTSAAFRGMLRRLYSRVATVTVTSLQPSTWLSYTTQRGEKFKYPPDWIVNEAADGTVTVSPPDRAQTLPIEAAAALIITYDQNTSGLSLSQYYNGEVGPDLFTGTNSISTTTVDGHTATQFKGLTNVPSDEAVVTPLSSAFVTIYASVPQSILTEFLDNLVLQ